MVQSIERAASMLSKDKMSSEDIELIIRDKLGELYNFSKIISYSESFDFSNIENVFLLENKSFFKLDIAALLDKFQEIKLIKCKQFSLFSSKPIKIDIKNHAKFLVSLINCQNFEVTAINIERGRNHFYVDNSKGFRFMHVNSSLARGYGLTIFNSKTCLVLSCGFFNNLASGINIIGKSSYIQIDSSRIKYSRGSYNWDAGINIMHCTQSINNSMIPNDCHEDVNILSKIFLPQHIIISNCTIQGCAAQGIYLEGAAYVYIRNSLIADNRKEGICFDWGTSFCKLSDSTIMRNGKRNSYSDNDCRIDFLNPNHRDKELTHLCQIPGISLDNAYSNYICSNRIFGNYGGGIKLVRSCHKNIFQDNQLMENSNSFKLLNLKRADLYISSEIIIVSTGRGSEFTNTNSNLDFLDSELNFFSKNFLTNQQKMFYTVDENSVKSNIFYKNTLWPN